MEQREPVAALVFMDSIVGLYRPLRGEGLDPPEGAPEPREPPPEGGLTLGLDPRGVLPIPVPPDLDGSDGLLRNQPLRREFRGSFTLPPWLDLRGLTSSPPLGEESLRGELL